MTTRHKPLRCWHGRWINSDRICVFAHSRSDAVRLLCQAAGRTIGGIDREIRDYFSECWSNSMNGITPERGVWLIPFSGAQPSRLI